MSDSITSAASSSLPCQQSPIPLRNVAAGNERTGAQWTSFASVVQQRRSVRRKRLDLDGHRTGDATVVPHRPGLLELKLDGGGEHSKHHDHGSHHGHDVHDDHREHHDRHDHHDHHDHSSTLHDLAPYAAVFFAGVSAILAGLLFMRSTARPAAAAEEAGAEAQSQPQPQPQPQPQTQPQAAAAEAVSHELEFGNPQEDGELVDDMDTETEVMPKTEEDQPTAQAVADSVLREAVSGNDLRQIVETPRLGEYRESVSRTLLNASATGMLDETLKRVVMPESAAASASAGAAGGSAADDKDSSEEEEAASAEEQSSGEEQPLKEEAAPMTAPEASTPRLVMFDFGDAGDQLSLTDKSRKDKKRKKKRKKEKKREDEDPLAMFSNFSAAAAAQAAGDVMEQTLDGLVDTIEHVEAMDANEVVDDTLDGLVDAFSAIEHEAVDANEVVDSTLDGIADAFSAIEAEVVVTDVAQGAEADSAGEAVEEEQTAESILIADSSNSTEPAGGVAEAAAGLARSEDDVT